MQEKAGEQGAAYIPMPKGRGFTPHFDKTMLTIEQISIILPKTLENIGLRNILFPQFLHISSSPNCTLPQCGH